MSAASRDVLLRCAEAWEIAAQALLLAMGWVPTLLRGGPWRDTTTDRTAPEHQALDEARRACEREPELRHFARSLDALDDSILLASGWRPTATKAGIAWVETPTGAPHTSAEGAALIRRQLKEGTC